MFHNGFSCRIPREHLKNSSAGILKRKLTQEGIWMLSLCNREYPISSRSLSTREIIMQFLILRGASSERLGSPFFWNYLEQRSLHLQRDGSVPSLQCWRCVSRGGWRAADAARPALPGKGDGREGVPAPQGKPGAAFGGAAPESWVLSVFASHKNSCSRTCSVCMLKRRPS